MLVKGDKKMKDDKTPRKTNTKKKGFITDDSILQREENSEMLKQMQEKAKEMSEKQISLILKSYK